MWALSLYCYYNYLLLYCYCWHFWKKFLVGLTLTSCRSCSSIAHSTSSSVEKRMFSATSSAPWSMPGAFWISPLNMGRSSNITYIIYMYRPLGDKFPRNLNLRFCGKLSECPGVVLNTTSFRKFQQFARTLGENLWEIKISPTGMNTYIKPSTSAMHNTIPVRRWA